MPPDFVETVESAAEWLIEQARSQNVHMKSTVSFFKESVSWRAGDHNALNAECGSDADVSRHRPGGLLLVSLAVGVGGSGKCVF